MAKGRKAASLASAARVRMIRRLELFNRELGAVMELYGNVGIKALSAIGRTSAEVLQAIDGDPQAWNQIRHDASYDGAEKSIGLLLDPPRSGLRIVGLEELLCAALPSDVYDKLVDAIIGFQSRFFLSNMQWRLDGPIAASLQFVRSASFLTEMVQQVSNLLQMEFEGPRDLDEQHRGYFPADYAHLLEAHANFMREFNSFRARLLEAATAIDAAGVDVLEAARDGNLEPADGR